MKRSPLFLLAPLFLGATASLLAFPMDEAPWEKAPNNFLSSRAREREEGNATIETDQATAASDSPVENSSHDHDIRAITPNIDNMSQVIGVDHHLFCNWVSAGFRNDTDTQNTTLDQIVQFIDHSKMTDQARADLKSDLAARSLEAQGDLILPNNEEPPSAKLAGDDPRRSHAPTAPPPTTAGPTWRDVDQTLGCTLAELQNSKLAHLAADFLVRDPEKQKKEYEKKYAKALADLRNFSHEIADAMPQELVPKTEEEVQVFKTKYQELIQTSVSRDGGDRDALNERVTRVYGLKAALEVLDAATEHRNCFLVALQNSTDPRMNRFYHEQIGNIDKTVQNLQHAAASILEMTENIIALSVRWREVTAANEPFIDEFVKRSNTAMAHAQESIRLNTQYAEAIRAGESQTARYYTQAVACSKNAAEAGYQAKAGLYTQAASYYKNAAEATWNKNKTLETQWERAGQASQRAIEATETGNHPLAELYTKAASYYKNAAEHKTLETQWSYDHLFSNNKARVELAAGNQTVIAFYTQAATCKSLADEATQNKDEILATRWMNASASYYQAAEAKAENNHPLLKLYTQAATYYINAANATQDKKEQTLARQWSLAGFNSYLAAGLLNAGRDPADNQFEAKAIAIVRSINKTLGEQAVQTFLPGSK